MDEPVSRSTTRSRGPVAPALEPRARTGTGFDTWVPMEVVVALWVVALLIAGLLAFAVFGGG